MIRRKLKRIIEEEKAKALAELSENPVACLSSLLEKASVEFTLVDNQFYIKTPQGDEVIISVSFMSKCS